MYRIVWHGLDHTTDQEEEIFGLHYKYVTGYGEAVRYPASINSNDFTNYGK